MLLSPLIAQITQFERTIWMSFKVCDDRRFSRWRERVVKAKQMTKETAAMKPAPRFHLCPDTERRYSALILKFLFNVVDESGPNHFSKIAFASPVFSMSRSALLTNSRNALSPFLMPNP